MVRKNKLTHPEMITYMESKGISFNYITKHDALRTLSSNTYYYKLTSYRLNWRKSNNRYLHLDFAYLQDIAIIDMHLRYLFLEMSLDLEHSIKSFLISKITEDPEEDGYTIVEDFKHSHINTFNIVIKDWGKSKYKKESYDKRHNEPAIWNLIEVMNFGSLSIFIDFYYRRKNQMKSLKPAYNLIKFSKNIRNASAHNSPLLLNIFASSHAINTSQSMLSTASQWNIPLKYVKYQKINDLIALFKLHNNYCSKELHASKKVAALSLIERMNRHSNYYRRSPQLIKAYIVFYKIVDTM